MPEEQAPVFNFEKEVRDIQAKRNCTFGEALNLWGFINRKDLLEVLGRIRGLNLQPREWMSVNIYVKIREIQGIAMEKSGRR